jgi:Amt family ammonium transporter
MSNSTDLELVKYAVSSKSDDGFMLMSGFLVFFMQCGFTLVEAGSTRAKNVGTVVLKNLLDFLIASVVFYIVGWGMAFGSSSNGFVGMDNFYPQISDLPAFFFQVTFAGTAATSKALSPFDYLTFSRSLVVSGSLLERVSFESYSIGTTILCLIQYPLVAHWLWSTTGFMSKYNPNASWFAIDTAGAGPVHLLGGLTGLVGTTLLGPRIGFKREQNEFEGHSLLLVATGTFILWFAW